MRRPGNALWRAAELARVREAAAQLDLRIHMGVGPARWIHDNGQVRRAVGPAGIGGLNVEHAVLAGDQLGDGGGPAAF
jgi:hypothetical protein